MDFNFNGWGGKQRHACGARIAVLVGEDGGIQVDGYCTGIMTESGSAARRTSCRGYE